MSDWKIMPIYEYACRACGYTMEKLQKISDAPLTDCPDCHEAALQKLVSAARFRLKGAGWYETDFKTGSKKNVAGEQDKAASKSDMKSEKSDTKSESTRSKSD